MDIEKLYNTVRSIEDIGERKRYLKTLTEEERKAYNKYSNEINCKKYNNNPENKKKYNEIRKNHVAKERKEEPEQYQEQNIKDLRTFREKVKKKKALIIISNAIRTKKAREELKRRKDIKERMSNLESLLSDLRKELEK